MFCEYFNFFKICLNLFLNIFKIYCEFTENFGIFNKFFSKFKKYFLLPPLCPPPTAKSLATALSVYTNTVNSISVVNKVHNNQRLTILVSKAINSTIQTWSTNSNYSNSLIHICRMNANLESPFARESWRAYGIWTTVTFW